MNHDPRIEIISPAALKITSGSTPQLAQLLQNTKPTDKPDELLVHWTLDNAVRLGLAGFDPPTPFRGLYKWKVTPYTHQVRTGEFITAHMRCGVYNEQGTGKTIAAIAAADYLHGRKKVRRVLVLCPLSVVYSAWCADLASAAPQLTVGVAHGVQDKRKAVLRSDVDVVIMNFDGLATMWETIKADGRFDLILIDEANAFKNPSTVRYKALAKIIRADTRVVLMTGTPASQSPVDAFGLSKLLGNPSCPKYKQAWIDAVMTQQSRFVFKPKADAAERVNEILRPSIRFSKADCLDLPDRVYVDRAVPLSTEQKQHYTKLKKEMLLTLDAGAVSAANAAVLLGKLMQISAGVVYNEQRKGIELDYAPRYEALREILEGTERKVIVFANFRGVIKSLVRRLNTDGIETEAIDGDATAKERQALIFRFQMTPSLRVLIIQPQAAAHGVTLTAADTTVWWGPPSSVELYKQANDRFHRIGQTAKCTVFHLTGSPAESKVYATLRRNIDVHEQAVALFSDIARS